MQDKKKTKKKQTNKFTYLLLKPMNTIMESDSPLCWIFIQQTRSGINFWNKLRDKIKMSCEDEKQRDDETLSV